jgi:hypothetical protein
MMLPSQVGVPDKMRLDDCLVHYFYRLLRRLSGTSQYRHYCSESNSSIVAELALMIHNSSSR